MFQPDIHDVLYTENQNQEITVRIDNSSQMTVSYSYWDILYAEALLIEERNDA